MWETIFPGLSNAQNFHPLFIHFPIAFWTAALVFWAASLPWGSARLMAFSRTLLYLGTLSAVAAAGTGLWAADQMGHDSPGHEFIHVHRNWMLGTAGAALLATGWAIYARKAPSWRDRVGIFGMLLVTNALLVLGADRGGYLVYERGVGTNVGNIVEEQEEAAPAEPHGVEVPDHAH